MNDASDEIARVRATATRLYTRAEVDEAFDRLAAQIAAALAGAEPIVVAVMVGGMYPALQIASRFAFPYRLDYLHATRYRGQLSGGVLQWHARPRLSFTGRVVLVVDDIVDEGHTLAEVTAECRRLGAASVLSAVLVRKLHDRALAGQADFCGLTVGDHYVFGCGMDYREYFRGLPEIYAVAAP
jgi:hypoxanthine phosphoribosyltransferase